MPHLTLLSHKLKCFIAATISPTTLDCLIKLLACPFVTDTEKSSAYMPAGNVDQVTFTEINARSVFIS